MTAARKSTISRLRMFAGPNGSGKSTIKDQIERDYRIWLGVYVNADNIEADAKLRGAIDFTDFEIEVGTAELRDFCSESELIRRARLVQAVRRLIVVDNKLALSDIKVNSYWAAAIAAFIRMKLLAAGKSLSFETVMSHHSKLEILRSARQLGYRNYLYFVTTKDPAINVSRVNLRVESGGHAVKRETVISRYFRTMDMLVDAVKLCDRAYIYDNSLDEVRLLADMEANKITLRVKDAPPWFKKYFLDKLK